MEKNYVLLTELERERNQALWCMSAKDVEALYMSREIVNEQYISKDEISKDYISKEDVERDYVKTSILKKKKYGNIRLKSLFNDDGNLLAENLLDELPEKYLDFMLDGYFKWMIKILVGTSLIFALFLSIWGPVWSFPMMLNAGLQACDKIAKLYQGENKNDAGGADNSYRLLKGEPNPTRGLPFPVALKDRVRYLVRVIPRGQQIRYEVMDLERVVNAFYHREIEGFQDANYTYENYTPQRRGEQPRIWQVRSRKNGQTGPGTWEYLCMQEAVPTFMPAKDLVAHMLKYYPQCCPDKETFDAFLDFDKRSQ